MGIDKTILGKNKCVFLHQLGLITLKQFETGKWEQKEQYLSKAKV